MGEYCDVIFTEDIDRVLAWDIVKIHISKIISSITLFGQWILYQALSDKLLWESANGYGKPVSSLKEEDNKKTQRKVLDQTAFRVLSIEK